MNIQLLNQNIADAKNDISLVYVTKDLLKESKNKKALKLTGFSAAQDSICFLHNKNILVCGVDSFAADDIRSVSAVAIKALKSTNYKSANVNIDDKSLIFALVEGFILGAYTYDVYKSKKEKT